MVFDSLRIELAETPLVGDVTCDCVVDLDDLLLVIAHWGQADDGGDTNGDGDTNSIDLLTVIGQWSLAC
ncbi:MAG: dockerin type I domain-containing protein [Phycisphaerales bacterium]|nr:dockerin type I domain-containing protein [Phycisphaerales bacterium]